jgi:hypothetical protein
VGSAAIAAADHRSALVVPMPTVQRRRAQHRERARVQWYDHTLQDAAQATQEENRMKKEVKPNSEKRYLVQANGEVNEITGHAHGDWFYLAPAHNQRKTVRRVLLGSTFTSARSALESTKKRDGFYIHQMYSSEDHRYKYAIEACFVQLQPDGSLMAVAKDTGRRLGKGYLTRSAARAAHIKAQLQEVRDCRGYLKRELDRLKEARALK